MNNNSIDLMYIRGNRERDNKGNKLIRRESREIKRESIERQGEGIKI